MKQGIFLFGRSGKMGQTLERLALEAGFFVTQELTSALGIIDFSAPQALQSSVEAAVRTNIPLVVGTTGLEAGHQALLSKAAKLVPVCYAANFSVGVALGVESARRIRRALSGKVEVRLEEAHHISKKDAPGGTALLFAKEIGIQKEDVVSHRTEKTQFVHEVTFTFGSEKITIKHESFSRDVYAQGALRALAWLQGKKPGLYSMEEML